MSALALVVVAQMFLTQSPGQCLTNAQCGDGAACDGGVCRRWCVTAGECGRGEVCSGHHERDDGRMTKGVCRVGAEGDPCRSNAQCSGELLCEGPAVATSPRSCAYRFKYTGTVPAGHRLVSSSPKWVPLIGGAALFAASWIVPGLIGAERGEGIGFIPLVGPVALGASANGYTSPFLIVAGVGAAVLQTIGASLFFGGLFSRTQWLQRTEPAPRVTVAPVLTSNGGGLSLSARF